MRIRRAGVLEVDAEGKELFRLQTTPYREGNHHNLRMVRKLGNGNYLVCHSGAGVVKEYSPKGETVWQVKPAGNLAFAAARAESGTTYVTSLDQIEEFDASGRKVWGCSTKELEGGPVRNLTGFHLLPNGGRGDGLLPSVPGGGRLRPAAGHARQAGEVALLAARRRPYPDGGSTAFRRWSGAAGALPALGPPVRASARRSTKPQRNHMKKNGIGRWALGVAVAVAAVLACVNLAAKDKDGKSMKTVTLPKYKNADFYQDGKFQVEKAKKAYFDMMDAYGYPVPEMLRTNMWATDFGLGDFVNVGMAGIFWINSEEAGYFAHEIYLLPGQMIVEHGHEATAKGKAKMESWHVRHGSIYTLGEEGGPIPPSVKLPKSQEKFITVSKCYEMHPGDIRTLNRVGAKHFMMGGSSGAIVSEYATFHDNDGLRFTNPGVKF